MILLALYYVRVLTRNYSFSPFYAMNLTIKRTTDYTTIYIIFGTGWSLGHRLCFILSSEIIFEFFFYSVHESNPNLGGGRGNF